MIRLFTFILLLLPLMSFANIAQPGVYTPGTSAGFSFLFPADSVHFKKVQMEREQVSVLLYKGYAVVKGEYWMRNSTEEDVHIRTGYPINGNLPYVQGYGADEGGFFDDLYGLKVWVGETSIELQERPLDSSYLDENWYVWEMDFPAQELTKVSVYFLVNTSNKPIRDGYESDTRCGFMYVLESGSTWKGPIGEGQIRIQLRDGLTVDDINGCMPDSLAYLSYQDADILEYQFANLRPNYKDNLLLTYYQEMDSFAFEPILAMKEQYFEKVDVFSKLEYPAPTEVKYFSYPHYTEGMGNEAVSIIMYMAIYGPVLLIALGIIAILVLIMRWLKRRKS